MRRRKNTKTDLLPASFDNPFITNLPDEFDNEKEFGDKFRFRPEINEARRSASSRQRAHCLIDALHLRVSLPRHWDLDFATSKLIRWSYTNRNPLNPRYWTEFKARMNMLGEDPNDIFVPPAQKSTGWGEPVVSGAVLSGLLIGGTGGGKSVSVERDLQQYPPVIHHGGGLNISQVPALKMEVTKGPRDFALTFFQTLDQILGTSYAVRFRSLTEYQMLLQVANLAFVHAVGLIVVDEFQNFGGCDIPKFLLRLNNISNASVLGIGTYKVERLLDEEKELKLYRRYTQVRTPDWIPLDRKEWSIYFNELWTYQVTRTPTAPELELSDRLFDECQGIPDFATRIYILSQDWLIARNHSGKNSEVITPALLSQIAETQLKPIRELLKAYRRRDWDFIKDFDDIRLPDVKDLLARTYGPIEVKTPTQHSIADDLKAEPGPASPTPTKALAPAVAPDTVRRIRRGKSDGPTVPCKLVDIVGAENRDPKLAYEALQKAGFIKNPTEFWETR